MLDEASTPDPLLDELTRLIIHAALLEAEIRAELQAELDTITHDERPAEKRGVLLSGGIVAPGMHRRLTRF